MLLARLFRFSCPPLARSLSQLSYVHGVPPAPISFSPMTMGQMLEKRAKQNPDRLAFIVVHQEIKKTYPQFNDDVDQLSKALIRIGCERGHKVGIWAVNSYEWLLAQFATAKLGCIFVNLNPGYKESEFEKCANLVGVETLIMNQKFKTSNYLERLQNISPGILDNTNGHRVQSKELPSLKNLIVIDQKEELAGDNVTRFSQLMKLGRCDKQLSDMLDPDNLSLFDDVINIQFTSGTTGSPKGAMLTNHNIIQNVRFTCPILFEGYTGDERAIICVPNPLYHCFGSVTGSASSIYSGATMVLPAPIFNVQSTLAAIDRYRCNYLYGTPTMWTDVSQGGVEKYNTASLKRGIMSGTSCPPELIKKMHQVFPTLENILIPYGATELSPIATLTTIHDSDQHKLESVGRPVPYVEIKIIDPVSQRIVPRETKGELCIRGHGIFPGYFNQIDKTNEVIDSNFWYHTGDIGNIDQDGYLSISGRIKEMIIRGGENIYPREVEDYLLANDKVQEVQVVGISDERLGEELVAFVKLTEGQEMTEEEVKSYLKERISHFKVPKHVRFVDDFPKTVTGKVRKIELKQMAIEQLLPDYAQAD